MFVFIGSSDVGDWMLAVVVHASVSVLPQLAVPYVCNYVEDEDNVHDRCHVFFPLWGGLLQSSLLLYIKLTALISLS